MTTNVHTEDDNRVVLKDSSADTFTLMITADNQPTVLALIAMHLNILNAAPEHLVFNKCIDDTIVIEIVLRRCSARSIDLLSRKVRQLTFVWSVDVKIDVAAI